MVSPRYGGIRVAHEVYILLKQVQPHAHFVIGKRCVNADEMILWCPLHIRIVLAIGIGNGTKRVARHGRIVNERVGKLLTEQRNILSRDGVAQRCDQKKCL